MTKNKTVLAFLDGIYEDLELWYPKLRLEEAGYALKCAAPEIKTYTDKVEAVTPAEVQAFAADVLKPDGASLIVVGDGKLFLEAFKAKAPNLEVIPIAQFDPDNPTLKGAP